MTGPVGGIDPHEHQFTVSVVDPNGVEIAHETFPNSAAGFTSAIDLLTTHSVGSVGVDGSGSWGAHIAIALVAAGFDAREVPPQRTAAQRRSRRLAKTDTVDAIATARALRPTPPSARSSPSRSMTRWSPRSRLCSNTAEPWSQPAPWSCTTLRIRSPNSPLRSVTSSTPRARSNRGCVSSRPSHEFPFRGNSNAPAACSRVECPRSVRGDDYTAASVGDVVPERVTSRGDSQFEKVTKHSPDLEQWLRTYISESSDEPPLRDGLHILTLGITRMLQP